MPDRDTVITVEHLSKRYVVGRDGGRRGADSLRDVIARRANDMGRRLWNGRERRLADHDESEFWALQDVSFEVKRGEVLGIVGRNGAGKSTLLKILSRITEPTRGRVRLNGRVASLLEVGTGFHAELTGRENIFLNGAILGMSRQEIKAKFDEIVAFAEVDRFLDTPVKRYSSGMYVKLAFAIAAHLEPEILIIDEVLAVGDIVFQKKCLGKIQDVAESGRTVLFVSHNIPAITGLTGRALLLENGRVVAAGNTHTVVASYLRKALGRAQQAGDVSGYRRARRTEGYAELSSVKVCGQEPGVSTVRPGEHLTLEVAVKVVRPFEQAIVVFNILNEQLEVLTTIISADSETYFAMTPGLHTVRCTVPALPLVPGDYRISAGIAQSGNALAWDVLEGLPGFRIDASEHRAWMESPERAGLLLLDGCQWVQS